jgi:anaerobic selenocysteine-containing dehydrogenase
MKKSEHREKAKSDLLDRGLERRDFLKLSSVAGGTIAAGMIFHQTRPARANIGVGGDSYPDLLETDSGVNIRYSACKNCHNACGIKCRVKNGVLLKIDGSPYHVNQMDDPARYVDPTGRPGRQNFGVALATARTINGSLCAKGQAGIQVLYNPYRLKVPLRRVGPRGSGQWESVSWDTALTEIAGGSPTLGTPGLASFQDLATDISADPAMGKKVNEVVCSPGRIQPGRSNFWDRFWKQGFGTANFRHDHTSICETSRHVANNLLSGRNHFYPDILDSQCMMWFGANPLECNFYMIPLARKVVENKKRGGKLIVVDPRLSHTAAKADLWLPIKPGTDAALAYAMARYIIENNLHDAAFMSTVKGPAAGQTSWTEATYLIRTDTNRELNANDAGIDPGQIAGAAAGKVVLIGGAATDITGLAASTVADLDAEITITFNAGANSVVCKTAFRLYQERAMSKTMAEYAALTGIDEADISAAAQMLVDAAPACSVIHYRGPAKHTSGTYNAMAIQLLNLLLGNLDHKGGLMVDGGGYDGMNPAGGLNLNTVPAGARPAAGIQITRVKSTYESTQEFASFGFNAAAGHPKRPWFPLAQNGNYQEIFPSMLDEYPYAAKAYFAYWNAIPYSTPASKEVYKEVLTATQGGQYQIQLAVSCDVSFSESAEFADFILPDTTYLERWTTPGNGPMIAVKGFILRVPVVGQFLIGGTYKDASDPTLTIAELNSMQAQPGQAGDPLGATPYYRPVLPNTMMLEDILIQLGLKINAINGAGAIPSIGTGAFAAGAAQFTPDLYSAWDWYRNMIENVAVNVQADHPGATSQQIYDRGGIFQNTGAELDAGNPLLLRFKFAKAHKLFSDSLAAAKDSMTGLGFDGLAALNTEIRDVLDQPVGDAAQGYNFRLVTYKMPWHGQARTSVLPWLMELQPTNYIEINARDGAALGIKTGDKVRLATANGTLGRENTAEGIARVTQRVRPGVVAVSHHYGHWAMSSKSVNLDGMPTGSDPKRGAGTAPNPVMRIDPFLGNVSLQDKIGGSVSFFDTMVKVTKL